MISGSATSVLNVFKQNGDSIGALAIVTIDYSMAAGTASLPSAAFRRANSEAHVLTNSWKSA